MKRKKWWLKSTKRSINSYVDGFIDGYVHAGKGGVHLLIDIDYNNDTYFRFEMKEIIAHTLGERYDLKNKVDVYLL